MPFRLSPTVASFLALAVPLTGCVFPGGDDSEQLDVPVGAPETPDQSPPVATGGAGSVPQVPIETGTGAAPSTGGTENPPAPAQGPCDYPAKVIVDVGSSTQLTQALAAAGPGTMIRLEAGTYRGDFVGSKSGTAAEPIVVCAEADATVSADDAKQDTFYLLGDHWILSGFTVSGGIRGVVLDGANFNQLVGLAVHGTGQEAIHLRSHSSDNVVQGCKVWDTGTVTPDFGEGIYIGSAKSNWKKYTGSESTPDRSDRNEILDNVLGPNIRAEHIDIKEGTQGGLIQGNTFNGKGISGAHFADSWVDVKGNDYLIADNTGTDTPLDGFQTHVVQSEWGHDITFLRNVARVNGPGYGISVSGDSKRVIVGCDNQVEAAGQGLSNRSCALAP